MAAYPRWVDKRDPYLLREVARNFYIGAERSPELDPGALWAAVVDLYGSGEERPARYEGANVLMRWPFYDGDSFPPGALDAIEGVLRGNLRHGPVLVHCQAGLSRSASAAYAMLRVLGAHNHAEALRRVKADPDFPRRKTLASARRWAKKRSLAGAIPLRRSEVKG